MPVHRGKDSTGSFYQWGHRKKYYYDSTSEISRKRAKAKAVRQAAAIYAHGWRER